MPKSRDTLLSRRDFAIASMAAGLAATGVAEAAGGIVERGVDITTADGVCDAVLLSPKGAGKSPAVLVWPDAYGLRPAALDIGRRLAANGYAALVVNQFYRARRAPVFPPGFSYKNEADRQELMKLMAVLDQPTVRRDARSFINFLDAQPEVDSSRKIGTVGFCMGGKITIFTASEVPDRVAAAVSFHGGQLTTDAPGSPHRLIEGTKASYHIAIAADDDEKEPNSKAILREVFDTTGRQGTVEVYPGALHGWMMGDSDIHNPAQAERGWTAMLGLYERALG